MMVCRGRDQGPDSSSNEVLMEKNSVLTMRENPAPITHISITGRRFHTPKLKHYLRRIFILPGTRGIRCSRRIYAGSMFQPTLLSIRPGLCSVLICILVTALTAADIRQLDQHFQGATTDIGSWMFVPRDNIREFSTTEHPGLAAIWQAGKGQDIKGILHDPIRIDDYPLPWEFQTSMVQAFNARAGVSAVTQVNYAIGLNLAVTFSDPSTWPGDRTVLPPDTRSVQLLVVHLGSTGEAGIGLPQYAPYPHPETYLVWGRGDLGHTVMGDWKIPFIWVGDGSTRGGPASDLLYFRARVISSTHLQIGIKFAADTGWNMRDIDCSEFGPITGIWEIGPIISGDRWIPDVLCPSLPMLKGPHPLFLGGAGTDNYQFNDRTMTPVLNPKPEQPNPFYEYYIDYCVFFGSSPIPFEQYSDDFDIPGYMGQWQIQPQGTIADTWTNPGHLALTLIGTGSGTGFGPVGGSSLNLNHYPPPWEIEICFTAPDDTIPWNFWMNFVLMDDEGMNRGMWTPGVENFPDEGRHGLFQTGQLRTLFEPPVPESVLAHKPLRMLIQCLDSRRVRLGFKAEPEDSWNLSKIYDTKKELGFDIGAFGMHCWSTTTGRTWGARPGCPMYQRFLIDYIHYRFGLSD